MFNYFNKEDNKGEGSPKHSRKSSDESNSSAQSKSTPIFSNDTLQERLPFDRNILIPSIEHFYPRRKRWQEWGLIFIIKA